MTKDNYKNEFEQSRQEIDITEGADGKKVLSRVDLHATANTANRSRFSLINILLVIFTLIPITILAFVLISLIFDKEPITPKVEDTTIQFEKSNKPSGSAAVADDEKEKEKENQQNDEKKKQEEKKKKEEEKKKAEAKKKAEEKKKAEAKKKKEEERKAAEQKRKEEEERKKAEAQKQKEEEERKKEEQQQSSGSHVVQPGETLYRISVIHYGNGDGVEKIRSANGISGNSISVGQTLVIPK